ncbi:hypothetical protein DACRYDRAFT_19357, partial [Dacryopinax primogenitus]
ATVFASPSPSPKAPRLLVLFSHLSISIFAAWVAIVSALFWCTMRSNSVQFFVHRGCHFLGIADDGKRGKIGAESVTCIRVVRETNMQHDLRIISLLYSFL